METKGLASEIIVAIGSAPESLTTGEIHGAVPVSPHLNETALVINGLKLSGQIELSKPKRYSLTNEGWIEFNRLKKIKGAKHKKPQLVVREPKVSTKELEESIVTDKKTSCEIDVLPPELAKAFDVMSKAMAPAPDSELKILVLDRLKDYVMPDVADVLESIKGDLRDRVKGLPLKRSA